MQSALRNMLSTAYGARRAALNLLAAVVMTAPALAEPVTVVALGDSLTAGYGLEPFEGLVPQLQAWLKAQGQDVAILNAGVSGDTTAGGLARLDWSLTPQTDALIVALGGNDMLRGLPPAQARANLEAILQKAQSRNLPVLLVGLSAPGNYGPDYKTEFDALYPDLAAQFGALLVPNMFAPLLGDDPAAAAGFFQPDGIHPNAEGVAVIVASLGAKVLDLVERVQEGTGG